MNEASSENRLMGAGKQSISYSASNCLLCVSFSYTLGGRC